MPHTELRLFGAPGCGKTTRLAKRVRAAVERFGSSQILITSFTKAGAVEIAGRDLPVEKNQVGTLHSICYRALDRPELTENHIDDWNKGRPFNWRIAGGSKNIESAADYSESLSGGDKLMSMLECYRARMIPRELWREDVCYFSDAWGEWKRAGSLYDFTDLIESSLTMFDSAPGSPSVLFVDEAQDLTKLQMTLIRQWAEHADYVLMAGDDDQALYTWMGADPDVFLNPPLPEKQVEILAQSYRLPRSVHALAERWIRKISMRQPKEYLPRDADGSVHFAAQCGDNPPPIFDNYIFPRLDDGATVMVLAACRYMLDPLMRHAKNQGIPFHNPYAKDRGEFNPLRMGGRSASGKQSVTAVQRLYEFLCPPTDNEGVKTWNAASLARWTDAIDSKLFMVHGAKALLKKWVDNKEPSPKFALYENWLNSLFTAADVETLLEKIYADPEKDITASDVRWFQSRLLSSKAKVYKFPCAVALRGGPPALIETPRLVFGTEHSVKGSTSDDVILLPDVSYASAKNWRGSAPDDATIRQTYVGITRARERLTVLRPCSPYYVRLL